MQQRKNIMSMQIPHKYGIGTRWIFDQAWTNSNVARVKRAEAVFRFQAFALSCVAMLLRSEILIATNKRHINGFINTDLSAGANLTKSTYSGDVVECTIGRASKLAIVDLELLTASLREILADMSLGACAETITQTVQILDLGNGKKAALRVTVTTDHDTFM
jgi:hypothetical protein